MIRLFDTLTGDVGPLVQREAGKVSLYACGPTVYDHPHLGHARQALTYDIVRRYLEWRGVEVLHVANVTDIDDNIINRANKEGLTEPEVAATWEKVYVDAMDALDILHPHQRPHATEYVDEMVAFVQTLIDNETAYANDSGVYLRVHLVPGYGDLVRRSLDDLRDGAGARVEIDENKEDPLDFALWKAAKPGEPSWPAPWGAGRPGWHIECVAMSLGILGDGFDLHGGGSDLVFPHHTNERAEAIAAGREFANHWMHNAMLNIGGEKMSKSLGNYTTVQALLDEHPLNGRALRLLLLQTHYRKTMELNTEVMDQARRAIERLDAMARK
ncbi:MAG: cysteine--tRNA ligase, partial [Actinomycetia bacterium]|nr:cysteine--tRNA ligase [Actinomycetes bacterium]